MVIKSFYNNRTGPNYTKYIVTVKLFTVQYMITKNTFFLEASRMFMNCSHTTGTAKFLNGLQTETALLYT